MNKIFCLLLSIIVSGCTITNHSSEQPSATVLAATKNSSIAKVLKVEATGQPRNYDFAVTISSPDTGCDRYADWWEVITPDGKLLYRRILLHSHVDDQPFTRTGGAIAIQSQQPVIIRVHVSPDGYSPMAQQGTVKHGFSEKTLPANFGIKLESIEPLPEDCAF